MTEQGIAGPISEEDSSGGDSATTVIIAFAANLAIAVAKTVVAMITGSASMLAESAHSWADTGNEILLVIAERRSHRKPDDSHPFGYGREVYVWSMFAALGLFAAGAAVSVWHGISSLFAESEETSYFWAYVVLGIAFVLEGISFAQAFRQTRREATRFERDVLEHALATSDPTLRAVFAEDAAALIGLVIAGLGILLHQLTGEAVYDAIGSILVGVLLGVVAIVLIRRNLQFLSGQESDSRLRDSAISMVKAMPEVDRVAYMRLEFVGPHQLLLVAAVDLHGEHPESQVAYTLRDLEHRVEKDPNVVEAVLTLATPDEPSL
jgi:cation diffusion facilitator family transporter